MAFGHISNTSVDTLLQSQRDPVDWSVCSNETDWLMNASASSWFQVAEKNKSASQTFYDYAIHHSSYKDAITLPAVIMHNVNFNQSLRSCMLDKNAEPKFQTPTIDQFTQDEKGLKQLIMEGWFHTAVDLTSVLLNDHRQFYEKLNVPFMNEGYMKLWTIRFWLMMRVRLFDELNNELSTFGTLENFDLYRRCFTSSSNVEGTIIPFVMRLIYAELPIYLQGFDAAFRRSNQLINVIDKMLSNLRKGLDVYGINTLESDVTENCLKLWLNRRSVVTRILVEACIHSRQLNTAVELLISEIDLAPIDGVCDRQSQLFSILGRVYLLIGDEDTAKYAFQLSLGCVDHSSQRYHRLSQMYRAFLSLFRGDYKDALDIFSINPELKSHAGIVLRNNLAVTKLYAGKSREATCDLEELVERELVNDVSVFNLVTLYDLQATNSEALKINLLKKLSGIPGDLIRISSLQMH